MKKITALFAATIFLTACNSADESNTTKLKSDDANDILFDASHGVTAGEADWVIDGGFSTFNDDINKLGFTTASTDYQAEITLKLLKQYQAFIMPEPNIPLKASEQQAIKDYVNSGGSIMMIADHYNADRNLNRFDASEIFNGYRRGAFHNITKGMSQDEINSDRMQDVTSSDYLSKTFGVRFRYNALDDVVLSAKDEVNTFGLLDNVEKVNMHAGSTIMITNPEIAKGIIYPEKLSKHDKWSHAVDRGVYTNGFKDEGAFIAISKLGKGKAVFIGDSSIVEDNTPKYVREDNGREKQTYDGIREMDHQILMENLVKWMMKQEDYSSFNGKFSLDKPTKVLKFEIPEQSTEPKREPWGTPGHNYKWYDPSTFEPGSFGKDTKHVTVPGSNHQQNNKSINNKKDDEYSKSTPDKTITGSKIDVQFPKTVNIGQRFTVDVYTQEQLDQVSIELIDADGEQVGLFDGNPPGQSRAYDTKKNENHFHSYFHGKIAREANGEITINIYAKNQLIQKEKMIVR